MFKCNFFSLDKWIITALFFAISSQGFFAFYNKRDASQVGIEAFAVKVVIFFRSIAGTTFHQFGFDILVLFVIVLKLYFSPKNFKVH